MVHLIKLAQPKKVYIKNIDPFAMSIKIHKATEKAPCQFCLCNEAHRIKQLGRNKRRINII